MNKTVFITGATSGIGEACANILAENGYDLILCGRRAERLEALSKDLTKKGISVRCLSFDVSKHDSVVTAISQLEKGISVDILINNAGNAHGLDPIQSGSLSDWEAMIDINVKGLLYVTREILPLMLAKGTGHIINVGSIAGKETYPGGNVYSASKYAVDALTESMRKDLISENIKVSQICPGLVNTEFSNVRFKGDTERASKVYSGIEPLLAKDIAEAILFMISRPSHVNIADMVIFPSAQASSTIVHRK